MSEQDFALLLHLAGVVFLFSGMSIAGVAHSAARRRDRPSEIALLLGLSRTGVLFVVFGGVFVLAGGIWLVAASGAYSFGDAWVVLGLALLVAAFTAGALGGRIPRRARLLAEQLARNEDAPTAELGRLLDDRGAAALNYCAGAAVVGALVVMVWKPGA